MTKYVTTASAAAIALALTPSCGWAQATSSNDSGLDEIVVTATKRGDAQNVQDVPFAVTAFGPKQLESQNFQGIESLSYVMPNVELDANNSAPGFANFAIRGQGIGGTIPTLESAVGVFVDGVYLGTNSGVVFDNFDLAGIEILRGPQGVLFGKNVTGGAVLIRTTKPTNTLTANAQVQLESGPQVTANATVSGPIVPDRLAAKLAVYYSRDEGYYTNRADNSSFGKQRTTIIRPALTWTPTDTVDLTIRYEHGRITGDGGPSHNLLDGRNTFVVNIDNRGFTDSKWDQVIGELNWDVGFGDGTITNIAAYRDFSGDTDLDFDATPFNLFNSRQKTLIDQFSNELRYAGTFGPVKLTTGLYYFQSNLFYLEHRRIIGNSLQGGGKQDMKTYGIFTAVDWNLTDKLILNAGIRYTYEKKDVLVSSIRAGGCDIDANTCVYSLTSKANWDAFTPKLGFQYYPSPDVQLYGFYARGFRAGGYNLRNTNPLVPPGPIDNEDQDTFEVGLKSEFGGIARLNLSAFVNKVKGAQRSVQTPFPGVGVAQVIVNAADATIKGFEAELTLTPARGLVISTFAGYLHGKYDKILYDISGNQTVGPEDLALKLIRLPPWSYGGSISYEMPVEDGKLTPRVSFSHRDKAFSTENNVGYFNPVDQLDFDISYSPNRNLTLSFYGKNMRDNVAYGLVSPNGVFMPGSTFGDLKEGRVYGGAIRWTY